MAQELRKLLDVSVHVTDDELSRFVQLAKGDLGVAANYYLDSPLSKLTLDAPRALSKNPSVLGKRPSSQAASPQKKPPKVDEPATTSAPRTSSTSLAPALAPARAHSLAAGQPVPYAHLADVFDQLSSTGSRLSKERILCAAFLEMLSSDASDAELVAMCYLLAPAKDSQSGGHRLLPDWEGGDVLNIGRSVITQAVAEATGTTAAAVREACERERDVGDAAVALRDGGEGRLRQAMLVSPPALTVRSVYLALLEVGKLVGNGAERRRANHIVRLLRAARGSELRWLVRTLVPHMAVGVSLDAKVLPALGMAFAVFAHAGAHQGAVLDPLSERALAVSRAARRCFALCPRVDSLVARLRGCVPPGAALERTEAQLVSRSDLSAEGALTRFVRALEPEPAPPGAAVEPGAASIGGAPCALDEVGAVLLGSPPQPMLAKAATSVADFVAKLGGGGAKDGGFCAELKYDGQRAQIHRLPGDQIRIFSRSLDEMSAKYPDVASAVLAMSTASSFIIDCEIVPVARGAHERRPGGGDATGPALLAFQSLSTRKRSGVTLENCDRECAVLTVAFDLLQLEGRTLLSQTYDERRALLRRVFPDARPSHRADDDALPASHPVAFALATSQDFVSDAGGEQSSAECEARVADWLAFATACGCEGLMGKRLRSQYEPGSSKRSDEWCKLKRDYIADLGDSLDLVAIGGWRGDGRKSAWVSPFLLACWDPESLTFQSVCRVISGFTDDFYAEHTLAYTGVADLAELAELANISGGGTGRLVQGGEQPADYSTKENCRYWFSQTAQPLEVWEVRGAELTVSPVHSAAIGLIDAHRGLSLRFPRFVRKRPDKGLSGVTTASQLAEMYRAQQRQQPSTLQRHAPDARKASLRAPADPTTKPARVSTLPAPEESDSAAADDTDNELGE